jgi:hypothetical protein
MFTNKAWKLLSQNLARHQSESSDGNSQRNLYHRAIYPLISLVLNDRPACLIFGTIICSMVALCGCGGMNYSGVASGAAASANSRYHHVALSSLSCGTQSLTGPQSKACSVYLSTSTPGQTQVGLWSNNSAVSVPSSVLVLSGQQTGGFIAVSSGVSQAQTVTLIATLNGVSRTYTMQLYPLVNATQIVTLNSISCGTKSLTGPETLPCSVYLSGATQSQVSVNLSSNNGAVAVPSSVTVPAGASSGGFNAVVSSVTSNQSVTITAASGGVTRTVAMQLLASTSPPTTTAYQVDLSWYAPTSSSDPVVGYRVYRSSAGSSSYQAMNSALATPTSYVDSNVQSGQSYSYQVTSVDASGTESAPSNTINVSVP